MTRNRQLALLVLVAAATVGCSRTVGPRPIPPADSTKPDDSANRQSAEAALSAAAVHSAAPPAVSAEPRTFSNSIGMGFALVPAGEFSMGTSEPFDAIRNALPEAKAEVVRREVPAHQVKISRSFWMGSYEVTVAEFKTFYDESDYKLDCEKDGKGGWGFIEDEGWFPFQQRPEFTPFNWVAGVGSQHPVVNVSWNDAAAFCDWLNHQPDEVAAGRYYRLPTEAEWEHACRAGTKTRYSFGDDPKRLTEFGNLFDASYTRQYMQSAKMDRDDHFALTAPVGSFAKNGFGLFDMHGNVWEWCADKYDPQFYSLPRASAPDPEGPSSKKNSNRVMRGGGFLDKPYELRSASRSSGDQSSRWLNVGFRVVCNEPNSLVRGLESTPDQSSRTPPIRKGKDYALLIAIENYEHPDQWKRLGNPIHDALSLQELLERSYGFVVKLLKDPTGKEILRAIREQPKHTYDDDDQLLIFIAGHGRFMDKIGYLVGKDAPGELDLNTYVSLNDVKSTISNHDCRHVLLAMDTCYGATIDTQIAGNIYAAMRGIKFSPEPALSRGRKDSRDDYVAGMLQYSTRRFLASGCGPVPDSSPFLSWLLKALGSPSDSSGIVTLSELIASVRKEGLSPIPAFGRLENDEEHGDFLFIRREVPRPARTVAPNGK